MPLILEYLRGPLDGYKAEIEEETYIGSEGEGPLVCPWDKELGEQQALFFLQNDEWYVKSNPSRHGTYLSRKGQSTIRIEESTCLKNDDIIQASETILYVTIE